MYFAIILDPTMKSDMIEIRFKHLIENGSAPMWVDSEGETFLNDDEVCEKMVTKVEKDIRVLFEMYKEKYGTKSTNLSSNLPKATSSQSTNTSCHRCNAFFKEKV